MTKQTGLGATITVDDSSTAARDISLDVRDFQFATPRGVIEVTGVSQSAVERLLGLADASVTLNGVMDTGSNLAHDVFKSVPSSSVERTVAIVVAAKTLSMEMMPTDYQIKRDDTAKLEWTVPLVLSNGAVPTWS
jgi:hypothetical protein